MASLFQLEREPRSCGFICGSLYSQRRQLATCATQRNDLLQFDYAAQQLFHRCCWRHSQPEMYKGCSRCWRQTWCLSLTVAAKLRRWLGQYMAARRFYLLLANCTKHTEM